jgi:hypothetical protein
MSNRGRFFKKARRLTKAELSKVENKISAFIVSAFIGPFARLASEICLNRLHHSFKSL